MSKRMKSLALWLVIILVVALLYRIVIGGEEPRKELDYVSFLQDVKAGKIKSVEITGIRAEGELSSTGVEGEMKHFVSTVPANDPDLWAALREANVKTEIREADQGGWLQILIGWAPMILLIAVWFFFMRQMQAGGNRALSFGKSRAKLQNTGEKKITFADVAGVDEAKEELQEIIEFLKDPKRFQRLGGRIPKGVLLIGPPGTGKTLLARAISGEANVPFFSISGSDFVEMFVGVGASRVRDLFDQGKRNAPCLIFIDEIDAVGRHRGAGLGGGHDEREQTLNALLVEMDGFESNEGIILIAASNRPDVLDPALLRPGRFDRQVVVDRPDIRGRYEILRVHTRGIPLSEDVDLEVIARGTPGFTGADLENLANEAAIFAARGEKNKVHMADFEEAKDKVLMGIERRSLILSEDEKRNTAYHEAGHVMVSLALKHVDPLHKVTIIPRGRALGVTQTLPVDDKHTYTKEFLEDQLAFAMGGRAAEEIFLKRLTTGAGNDIDRATELARRMVCDWGMSEEIGPLSFGKREEHIFLGREIAQAREISEETARKIDEEIKILVMRNYQRANKVIQDNMEKVELIARTLLEREVLDGKEIDALLAGEKLAESAAAKKRRPPADSSGKKGVGEKRKEQPEPKPAP
jgi:cell division protease FtsH